MVPSNLTKEQQARLLIELRNHLKKQARSLMADREAAASLDQSDPIRDAAYYINHGRNQGYNDDALWDYLIESSQRANEDINRLFGLGRK